MTPELIGKLLDSGCPVRAAELLLASRLPRMVSLLDSFARGVRLLPVPEESPVRNALRERFGRDPDTLSPQPGVYALCVENVDGQDYGSVERVVAIGAAPASADDFTNGIKAGEQSARSWIVRVLGALEHLAPCYFTLERVPPLSARTKLTKVGGESAGLAAALNTVWHRWPGSVQFIAATGRVDADGRVKRVEFMTAKLEGLHREAPFIRRVLVPKTPEYNQRIIRDGLEIIPVSTVDEALEEVFGGTHVRVAVMPPLDAAYEAVRLELEREHALAENYAVAARRGVENNALSDDDRGDVLALTNAIAGIAATHRGKKKEAVQSFQQIAPMLTPAADGTYRLGPNLVAQLAAMHVSSLIDTLDFTAATDACKQYSGLLKVVDPVPELMLRGSWARALTAAGRLEEAREQALKQCNVRRLKTHERHQLVQAHCNLIDAELHLHLRGDVNALGRAQEAFRKAHEYNAHAEHAARERNLLFLSYWEVRIQCAGGQTAEARQRAVELANGFYPGQLLLRYVAEACRRGGEVDAALELLVRARTTVSSRVEGFVRLVLMSSTALECRIRLERGVPDVREPAHEFAQLLDEWKPGFIQWPADRTNHEAWITALEDAVTRLPY